MKIKRIPAGMYGANCYILIDGNEGCIIDPGGDADMLIRNIDALNIDVKFILLTHGHMDHTRQIAAAGDWLHMLSTRVPEKLRDKPALIVWPMRDRAFPAGKMLPR